MKKTYLKKSYRTKRKKSLFRNRFFWVGVLGMLFLVGVFYLICFCSFFQIEKIEISDNQKVNTRSIENLIEKEISKKILFFSSKSIFLANMKEIQDKILQGFPQIVGADLQRKFPDILKIRIEERKPVAVFCQDKNYFFIDKKGVLFEQNIDDKMLKIKSSIFGKEVELGKAAVNEEKLAQILDIYAKLKKNLKIQIDLAEIISEQRLNVKTSEGWEVCFNTWEDIDWQIVELDLVLKEKILPETRENLKYIDLRFDKIYFK